MTYHQSPIVDEALIELLDALCKYKRATGLGSTLILIPHAPDEPIVVARDGKPGNPRELNVILGSALMNHFGTTIRWLEGFFKKP